MPRGVTKDKTLDSLKNKSLEAAKSSQKLPMRRYLMVNLRSMLFALV